MMTLRGLLTQTALNVSHLIMKLLYWIVELSSLIDWMHHSVREDNFTI